MIKTPTAGTAIPAEKSVGNAVLTSRARNVRRMPDAGLATTAPKTIPHAVAALKAEDPAGISTARATKTGGSAGRAIGMKTARAGSRLIGHAGSLIGRATKTGDSVGTMSVQIAVSVRRIPDAGSMKTVPAMVLRAAIASKAEDPAGILIGRATKTGDSAGKMNVPTGTKTGAVMAARTRAMKNRVSIVPVRPNNAPDGSEASVRTAIGRKIRTPVLNGPNAGKAGLATSAATANGRTGTGMMNPVGSVRRIPDAGLATTAPKTIPHAVVVSKAEDPAGISIGIVPSGRVLTGTMTADSVAMTANRVLSVRAGTRATTPIERKLKTAGNVR
ncbi:hypothetical protein GCM10027299_29340 [Larkinella ripae]